ncbi:MULTISPECIES: hypothetical protein [Shewanella]|uniref:hypothetical protein n=1 Tax=Shewanella TaxID=22 RepID=UPI000B4A3EE7|nr:MULTISPECIES: hypothetical protein [unclassified Shewanella]QYJ69781.1 hypothetical protein K0H59_12035 [Shewanella sp. FJAT-51649]
MKQIRILDRLELSFQGVKTTDNEEVALRQGDMDGACGPYSVLMGLIYQGAVTRDEVTSLARLDGRTRIGKFMNCLYEFNAMVRDGTDEDDLVRLGNYFKSSPYSQINIEPLKAKSTKELAHRTADAIDDDKPVLIWIDWQGGGAHWALVVGYEFVDSDDSGSIITKLLLLDPSEETPRLSHWNGVIHVTNESGKVINSGQFPSDHWAANGEVTSCKIRLGLEMTKELF